MPDYQGTLMLGSPLTGPVALGTITHPSGQLTLRFEVPPLFEFGDGLTLLLQSLTTGVDGNSLGGGTAFVWLAAGL